MNKISVCRTRCMYVRNESVCYYEPTGGSESLRIISCRLCSCAVRTLRPEARRNRHDSQCGHLSVDQDRATKVQRGNMCTHLLRSDHPCPCSSMYLRETFRNGRRRSVRFDTNSCHMTWREEECPFGERRYETRWRRRRTFGRNE